MQKKCRRCGEWFTPVDGGFYCEKCGGTAAVAMPDERPEITAPEIKKYTLKEATEKANITIKDIYGKLNVHKSTFNNWLTHNYMPVDMLEKFTEIVGIPKTDINCRYPTKTGWGKATQKIEPEKWQPVPVPEVKQAVSESVESVNKAFPETAKLSNIVSLDMLKEIQDEAYKIRSLHFAITLASEAGLPKNDLIDAMNMFDDILKMHCDNISKRI